MSYEQQAGRGVLFMETRKKHEKAPDWKGTLTLDRDYKAGEQIKLAAWTKKTSQGQLLSVAIDSFVADKIANPSPPKYQYPREVTPSPELNDDVPF